MIEIIVGFALGFMSPIAWEIADYYLTKAKKKMWDSGYKAAKELFTFQGDHRV
jgi:hypothetical protein